MPNFEGYNPTKAERAAIERAHGALSQFTRSDWELNDLTKRERTGYGVRSDSIPLIAAKGLLCSWFLYGLDNPDQLLRDTFDLRPVAVYMQGLGARAASRSDAGVGMRLLFATAQAAHDAAFDRMMNRDRAAIAASVAAMNEARP